MSSRVLFLFGLIALANAYTTFDTICSKPSAGVNFVSSADTRGTLDILWNCLFTIIACTWTVQYLNVPEQREGRDPGWRGDIKWALKRTWTSTKWMLATVIAPEILLGLAWGNLDFAKRDLVKFKKLAHDDNVPWTLTHSMFANMGGFVIRWNTNPTGTEAEDIGKASHADPEISEARPINDATSVDEGIQTPDYANPFHLTCLHIIALRESGHLSSLPHIATEEINDKSKSDTFTRLITIFQITWSAAQIITRAAKHLAISQMEIAVLAFAACAIIIYGLNWKRPKGVEVSSTLLSYQKAIPKDIILRFKEIEYQGSGSVNDILIFLATLVNHTTSDKMGSPVFNTYYEDDSDDRGRDFLGLMLGSMVFGGLHLAAWNFDFPTRAEQIGWWMASIFCTTCSVLLFISVGLLPKISAAIVIAVFCALYVLARLFLMVEIFRTLCFLPPDAYIATWASNAPNVS